MTIPDNEAGTTVTLEIELQASADGCRWADKSAADATSRAAPPPGKLADTCETASAPSPAYERLVVRLHRPKAD